MRLIRLLLGAVLTLVIGGAATTAPKHVTVTGEVIDTWCYVSGIMFAVGTAHHQCAVWCAVGGIPVSIKGDDGKTYVVLKTGNDATSVAPPSFIKIETHKVTVSGELYEQGGNRFLLVSQVMDDKGIVNFTHEEQGIQPFGD